MNIRPTGDNIVVEPDEVCEEESPGGIIIHEAHVKEPDRGRVIAVGSGMLTMQGERVECEVKEGDKVLYDPNPMQCSKATLGGVEYAIMREANVRAILS